MMNLKSDAVQAGNLPPEFPLVKPLEVRIGNLLINLFDNTWTEQIKANLIATEYEYLTFIAYGCQQVPLRLTNLITDSGISETAIANCIAHYDLMRQEKTEQAQTIVKDSPESAIQGVRASVIAFQTKILERVSSVVQNNTVEELVGQRVISQSVVSSLARAIDKDI